MAKKVAKKMNKIRGSHLHVAVANLVVVKTIDEKLATIAQVVQPGFTYDELLEIIKTDGEIPEQYIEKLIAAGIQFPDYESPNKETK